MPGVFLAGLAVESRADRYAFICLPAGNETTLYGR